MSSAKDHQGPRSTPETGLVSHGISGHGSVPLKSNAIVHLAGAVARVGEWRPDIRLNELAVDMEDGPKGFGAHSDQERILESELYRFVRLNWDVVTGLPKAR